MIRLSNVSKKFGTGVFALSDINFEIEKGEFVFLVGPTGSGKTTIFRLIIREMIPTKGEVIVDDWDIVKLPDSKIPHLRKKIGVIFQDLKLLSDRTIFENIVLPLEVSGIDSKTAARLAHEVMEKVGIYDHKDKFPIQLSGGELQRAAIARSLILEPDILLADEPTGNLDHATAMEIVNLLSEINKKGTTIIMATHNEEIIKTLSRRVLSLDKGVLAGGSQKAKKSKEQLEEKSVIINEKEKSEEKVKSKENKEVDEDF